MEFRETPSGSAPSRTRFPPETAEHVSTEVNATDGSLFWGAVKLECSVFIAQITKLALFCECRLLIAEDGHRIVTGTS